MNYMAHGVSVYIAYNHFMIGIRSLLWLNRLLSSSCSSTSRICTIIIYYKYQMENNSIVYASVNYLPLIKRYSWLGPISLSTTYTNITSSITSRLTLHISSNLILTVHLQCITHLKQWILLAHIFLLLHLLL